MKINCAHTELLSIEDLNPHPKNRNKHSSEQIERLAKILQYQGWRRPIRVSKLSGHITAGHGALLAARKNEWTNVPVDYQDYENEEQEYADVQADNAIAAWAELDLSGINLDLPDLGPDFDIDMLGLKDFELEPADKYGDKDADEVPEARKTEIKLGDLFQLGSHRLLCGDSTVSESVARLMNGEKADMVYTDPPYGDTILSNNDGSLRHSAGNKKYHTYANEGNFSFKNFYEITKSISDAIIIWGGQCFVDVLPISLTWIVWDKTVSEDNGGNWFSDCELAWATGFEMPIVKIRHIHQGFSQESKEDRLHPTQKPVDFHLKCWDRITRSNRKNLKFNIIADLFLGSGSTLIACEKTNRKCFGMEIDPQYCQVIIDRWEKFAGQKAVKL